MIIKTSIITKGKACTEPKVYRPNKEVFERYAHLYQKEADDLYKETLATMDNTSDVEELSSEEKEDREIRTSDILGFSLFANSDEARLETYIFDEMEDEQQYNGYVHQDVFLHEAPTSMAVLDIKEDPIAFISNEDGTIVGYNIFVYNHFLPDLIIDAHTESIKCLEIFGTTLISNDKHSLKTWDATTLKNTAEHKNPNTQHISICGDVILYSSDSTLFQYDQREGSAQKLFSADHPITAIGQQGAVVAAGTEQGSILYTIKNSRPTTINPHTEAINTIVPYGDQYIVSSSQDQIIAATSIENADIIFKKDTGIDDITFSISKENNPEEDILIFPNLGDELEAVLIKELYR